MGANGALPLQRREVARDVGGADANAGAVPILRLLVQIDAFDRARRCRPGARRWPARPPAPAPAVSVICLNARLDVPLAQHLRVHQIGERLAARVDLSFDVANGKLGEPGGLGGLHRIDRLGGFRLLAGRTRPHPLGGWTRAALHDPPSSHGAEQRYHVQRSTRPVVSPMRPTCCIPLAGDRDQGEDLRRCCPYGGSCPPPPDGGFMKSRLALPFAFALATTIGACATGETDETGTGGTGGDSGSAGTSGAAGTTGAAGHGGTTGSGGHGDDRARWDHRNRRQQRDGRQHGHARRRRDDGNGRNHRPRRHHRHGRQRRDDAESLGAAAPPVQPAAPGRRGIAGRGGTTGAAGSAGTTGIAGRGGTTGTAGTTGNGGHGRSAQQRDLQLRERAQRRVGEFRQRRSEPESGRPSTRWFKNTYAAGGRVIRWWFHTNGTVTPGYGGRTEWRRSCRNRTLTASRPS